MFSLQWPYSLCKQADFSVFYMYNVLHYDNKLYTVWFTWTMFYTRKTSLSMYNHYSDHNHYVNMLFSLCFTCTMFYTMKTRITICFRYNKHIHHVSKLCSVCFKCTLCYGLKTSFSMSFPYNKHIHHVNMLCSVCYTCTLFNTMKTSFSMYFYYTVLCVLHVQCFILWKPTFQCIFITLIIFNMVQNIFQNNQRKQAFRCVFFISIFTM